MSENGQESLNGKAFEYACLMTIYRELNQVCTVHIEEGKHFHKVKTAFEQIHHIHHIHYLMAENMIKAGCAGVRLLKRYEPLLTIADNNSPLILKLNKDANGEEGDVRDIICRRNIISRRRTIPWEIGISCKHNSEAVKHSRLSNQIDFGDKWLGHPCSQNYWDAVLPIFGRIETLGNQGYLWRDFLNPNTQKNQFYEPILTAFKDEFKRISTTYSDAPSQFVHYAIGKFDFYKIIARDDGQYTKMQVANFNGTLNKKSSHQKPIVKIQSLPLPTRLVDISYPETDGLRDTIILIFDCGWSFSLRLHNGDSDMNPSLKFDIQIIGHPVELYSTDEPWEEQSSSGSSM